MPPVAPLAEANIFIQYANVFIPLGISLMGAIVSFVILREKVAGLVDDVKGLKTEMREMRDKVIACETTINVSKPLVKARSPLSLTDFGQSLLKTSGGEEYIDKYFNDLYQSVEAKKPKTAYDVQELSKKALDDRKNDDSFNPLKEYLFKEGRLIDDLVLVMSIYLRDKILDKKNWSVSDIDKDKRSNTPNEQGNQGEILHTTP
jgi:hypothetical protein